MPQECITPCVDIDITQLTTGELVGTGVFDILMKTSREHLIREHSAGRITGQDFTNAYISMMQAVMVQATQYALMKDKTAYDISLVSAQTNLVKQQEDNAIKEGLSIEANTAFTEARTLTEASNKELVDQQVLTQTFQQEDIKQSTLLKVAQEAQIDAETLNIPKQGIVIDKQAEKITSDISLTEQQKINLASEKLLTDEKVTSEEISQTVATKQGDLLTQQKANLSAEALNIPKQGELIEAQIAKNTEETIAISKQTGFTTLK